MALTGAVFLDKDGTLLEDVPYNVEPEKMRPAAGVMEGLRRLADTGMPLIVVSNQSGLAMGKFDEAGLEPMLHRLREMFREAGAELAGFHYCPHHPAALVDAYRVVCGCRKPSSGLFHIAARQHEVDLSRSWMVGDILDDIEAGRKAGCRSILIDNGNETEWLPGTWRIPDHTVGDFAQAAEVVTEHARRHERAYS